jgi:hypothetical protein
LRSDAKKVFYGGLSTMPNILEAFGIIALSIIGIMIAVKIRWLRGEAAGIIGILYGLYLIIANIWLGISSLVSPLPTAMPTATEYLPPTISLRSSQPPEPMGIAVTYKTLQITLLKVTTHDLIYMGGDAAWYPKSGDRIIDIGVLVKNSGSNITVQWKNIGIEESNGTAWYPSFAGVKTVSYGQNYDPFNIKISETNESQLVSFTNDTYLRLIFSVRNIPQTILFSIEDSPYTSFNNP